MVQIMAKQGAVSPRIAEFELNMTNVEFFQVYSAYSKLLEACLYGNSINPHLIMSYLISLSRTCFNEEVCC